MDNTSLIKAISALRTAVDNMGTFPTEINAHIISEPPKLSPLPVTNFNINALEGVLKTTAVTVGTSATLLPASAVLKRRSWQVYNTDASKILYIGGSDVTKDNGMPVYPKSYSQVIDAGTLMLVYGIVESGSVEARVIEITNNLAGR